MTPDLGLTATAEQLTAIAAYTPTVSATPTITRTPYPTITPIPSSTVAQSSTPLPQPSAGNGTDTGGTPGTPGTPIDTPSVPFACIVTSKSPSDWTVMKQGNSFDGSWQITNSGLDTWKSGEVVLTYLSGNKFQEHKDRNVYNIPADVLPGASTTLIVSMIAPTKPSNYSTTWGLLYTSTKTVFCTFSLRITISISSQ